MTASARRDDFIRTFIEPLQARGKIKDYYNSKRGFRCEAEINAQANILFGVSSFFEVDDAIKIKKLQDWAKVESKRLRDSGGRAAAILGKYISYLDGLAPSAVSSSAAATKSKKATSKTKSSTGENIIYHILNQYNTQNPPDDVKYMIETLILGGGIWFKPDTYQQIPMLVPYVIRDKTCRKKKPSSGKDEWGCANMNGLMKDDNTAIKGVPRSLRIESILPYMNGKTMGNGFVASHVWIQLRTKPVSIHACNWECSNSFIPNLVWLPVQLSKLTDRDNSYAQRFIQHISYLLYRKVPLPVKFPATMIWNELQDPGITPISTIDLSQLNYFENNSTWIAERKAKLKNEIESIINVLNGYPPVITPINNKKYLPSLVKKVGAMSPADKLYLEGWLNQNL